MSTTTPNMLLTKPDPDGSVGTWDTELNASLDVLDAHDHSAGKGVLIPVAALNINSDLPLANFALTQVKALAMAAVASSTVAALSRALFVNSADNELYWKTSGGVLVKLTSGTSLNAALLGGFTGDYGTGGSEANFNSGTSIYNFLRAANHRAFLDSSDIRLFQGTSGITAAVKIRSPNALAASYDWIFPAALPAAQSLVQLGTGGQVVASNVIATNEHVTVAGTGRFKHGSMDLSVAACAAESSTGTYSGAAIAWTLTTGQLVHFPCPLPAGARVLSIGVITTPTGAGTRTVRLRRYDGVTGGLVTDATATNTTLDNTLKPFNIADTVLVDGGDVHIIEFEAAGTQDVVRGIVITYDFP